MAEAVTAEPREKRMEAIIISLQEGYKIYRNVRIVRIKDKRYNLLIMVDYMPMVGDIDGELTILTEDGEIRFGHVTGFYFIKGNVFKLLMKEDDYVE